MASVYLETTIISYLTGRSSRDVVVAGHQQTTREWWDGSRKHHDLFVSEVVLREMQAGDAKAAELRMRMVEGIPCLGLNADVEALAHAYHTELQLPPKAGNDVLHISLAVSYELDYLVTWNCTHIANGYTIKRLVAINDRLGRKTPIIVTPEELMEECHEG